MTSLTLWDFFIEYNKRGVGNDMPIPPNAWDWAKYQVLKGGHIGHVTSYHATSTLVYIVS